MTADRSLHGFTLLEMIIVVVILGIAAAATVPAFSRQTARMQLQKAADDLAYTIRYAQLRAMGKALHMRLHSDPDGYWLEQNQRSRSNTGTTTKITYKRLNDRDGKKTNLPAGITIEATGSPLDFSPDGRMTLTKFKICRDRQCLYVSTSAQRGRVEIIDPEGTDDNT